MWTVQSSSAHSSTGNGGNMVGELVEPLNPLPFFTRSRQHFDSLKKGELEKLHQLFTRGVHRMAMPYSDFEHPTWKDLSQALHSCFQLPSSTAISGELMRTEYAVTMNDVLLAFGKHSLICFTLDGATNLLGKQVINMMACGPKPFFLEHFTMELRTESATNLLKKLLNCKLRLLGLICQLAPGFVLSRDGKMFDDNNIEVVEQ